MRDALAYGTPFMGAALLALTEQFWQAIITGLIAGLVALGVALINNKSKVSKVAAKVDLTQKEVHDTKVAVEPDSGFSLRDVVDRMEQRQVIAEQRQERTERKVDELTSIPGKVHKIDSNVNRLTGAVEGLIAKFEELVENKPPRDPEPPIL